MRFLEHLPMLTTVALTLLLTLVLPQIMRHFRLPGVVGWILAGVLLGPHLSGVLHVEGQFVAIFAGIGKLMLMFFAGFEIDFRVFYATLVGQPLLVVGIVGALLGGKWLAARLCGAIVGYPAADRAAMFALSVPQVAATLAVALVAYGAKNAAGERLIDQPILNATIVLVVVTSLGGLLLAGRAAAAMGGRQPAAPKTTPAE